MSRRWLTSVMTNLPLSYFKFGKPVKGKGVPVTARVEMTEAWFMEQRIEVIDQALRKIEGEMSI
jgi:hypothetical protein